MVGKGGGRKLRVGRHDRGAGRRWGSTGEEGGGGGASPCLVYA